MTIANAAILDLDSVDDDHTMQALSDFKSLRSDLGNRFL